MAFVSAAITARGNTNGGIINGAGTNYLVETDAGALYLVVIDSASDVVYCKSVDGGKTWASPVSVFTGTALSLSIWFDPWSGIAGGLIHCAYVESGGHDVLYRSINTASADALGTQTTIFAGASATADCALSITRTRGGNLLCAGTIDNGTEDFAKKSTDVGATWGNIAAVMEATTADQLILAPGFAADDEDAICIFWDSSGTEISRKLYDDSGDSWAETSIATSMTVGSTATSFPNFSIAPDLANSRLILAAWSAVDAANADLRCWFVSESAITETATNVVLNSTDDQGFCGVSLDTTNGDIYVFYLGASSGVETFVTLLNMYYKLSTDDGATWGSETKFTPSPNVRWLVTNPRQVYLSAELVAASANSVLANVGNYVCISIAPTLPTEAQVQSGVDYGINGVEFEGTYAGAGSGGNANILRGSVIA